MGPWAFSLSFEFGVHFHYDDSLFQARGFAGLVVSLSVGLSANQPPGSSSAYFFKKGKKKKLSGPHLPGRGAGVEGRRMGLPWAIRRHRKFGNPWHLLDVTVNDLEDTGS